MTTALQLRKGTTAQHASFTGANAEVTVDTTKKTVVVHDGVTPGGTPLAKEADAANRVRYDVATQGLSDAQKGNARTNIGAAKDPGAAGWIVRLADGSAAARTLTAGSGISISNGDGASGDPVITNTGVRSINGQTGDVSLTTDLSSRVAKTGDTMTGPLTISGAQMNLLWSGYEGWKLQNYNGEVFISGLSVGDKFRLNTGGQLWLGAYGWLHNYFSNVSHTHSGYVSANMTHGAVGSLCFAGLLNYSATPGTTQPGSRLYPAGVSWYDGAEKALCNYYGSTLSGTWRCLGTADGSGNPRISLWQRIS